MADTFTPRGAPVPSNSYDGWELTHRPAMLPFLAEYTNPQGETAGGWAMPNMVTEPINALFRLMNTPAGTMPDPRDPQNQSDALTGLMALYGGNAVGGVARNALGKGVAHGLEMGASKSASQEFGLLDNAIAKYLDWKNPYEDSALYRPPLHRNEYRALLTRPSGILRNDAFDAAMAVARENQLQWTKPTAIDEAMSNPNMLRMMDDIDYADLNRRALDQYGVGYEGLNSSQEAALRGWSYP